MLFLNRPFYSVDQTVDFYISGFNRGTNAEIVDVHVGIIDANGTIYEYPNWNTNLVPWLSSFTIPANFQFPVTLLGNLDNFPNGLKPGSYHLAVAFTSPNTLNLLSFNTVAFKVLSLENPVTGAGISFGHGQSANNITEPLASAVAIFSRDEPPSNFQEKLDQVYTDIEECEFFEIPFEDVIGIDAGASVSLSSPATGNIVLEKSGEDDISYSNFSIPESFYQAGQRYTVSGNGSTDIPAFSVSATSPKEIVVIQPDLSTLTSIDSSQDFVIRWQGNSGVGEIEIALFGQDTSANTHTITCRVADDGELIIPSSLLVQLRDVVAPTPLSTLDILNNTEIDITDFTELLTDLNVSLMFTRSQLEFINNDDEDSGALFIFWASGLALNIK